MNRLRLLLFVLVAELHCMAILFVTFNMGQAPMEAEEKTRVMKLVDITEYVPPPPDSSPPPPPPPPRDAPPPPDNAVETIAEEMFETEEAPENQTVVEAGSIVTPQSPASFEEEEYLPPHRISVGPGFPNAAFLAALRYPPIARRSNIEGRVILDLFVDRTGAIRRIEILLEEPLNRGFGEAAVSAIWEAMRNPVNRCIPAQANGAPVSARVRYPVTFRLR